MGMVVMNIRRGNDQFLGLLCDAVNDDGGDSCGQGGAVPMVEQEANEDKTEDNADACLQSSKNKPLTIEMPVPITAAVAVAVLLPVLVSGCGAAAGFGRSGSVVL